MNERSARYDYDFHAIGFGRLVSFALDTVSLTFVVLSTQKKNIWFTLQSVQAIIPNNRDYDRH